MITIRIANAEETGIIIRFQQNMALETEGLELNSEAVGAGVAAVFKEPSKGQYYVAEDNGKVIASLLITYEWSDWRNGNVWWIQSVFVIPEYRRKGVFRKMYEHVRETGLAQGIAGLRLYVDSENIRAQKVYDAMGMNGTHYKLYEWMK